MSDKTRKALTTKEAGTEMVKDSKIVKAAAVKKERAKLTPPPPPPVKIGEVENPIIGNKNLKRAMAVAIVMACTRHTKDGDKVDEAKACMCIRLSGIPYKSGWKADAETEALTQNEWGGRPYARFVTNTPEGKNYKEKHPEKVKKCEAFAKALKHAFDEMTAKAEEAKPKAEEKVETPAVAAPATA